MAGGFRGLVDQIADVASDTRDQFLIESAGAGGIRGLMGNIMARDIAKQHGGERGVGSLVTMLNQGAAPDRGTAELIQAYRHSPWLRAVVSRIAWSVASTRWQLFVVSGKDGKPTKSAAAYASGEDRRKILRRAADAGQSKELLDHPMLDMIRRPNPFMSGLQMRKTTQSYIDLKGEGIWVIERDLVGVPREIWVVPPNWMTDIATVDKPTYEFTFSTWRRTVPAEDVVYFRDADLVNPYGRGSGVGESLGDEIETDEFAAKYIKSFFHNSARPDMIVSLKGASGDTLRSAKRKFENAHKGVRKGRSAFWTGRELDIKTLGQSFHDMEMIGIRTWERDTFIQVFGVPPEILGITKDSNRATSREARKNMADFVTIPRLELIREEKQEFADREFGGKIVVDYVDPTPDDKEMQLDYFKASPQSLTQGEIRKRMGEADRGDQDNFHYVPVNLVPIESEAIEPMPAVSGRQLGGGKVLRLVDKMLTEADIDMIIGDLKSERLVDSSRGLWGSQIEEWGQADLDALGVVGVSFDIRNPLVTEHLAAFDSINIVQANTTTQAAVRAALSEGVLAGEGVRKLKGRVTEVFDAAAGYRSERIARTEVLRSSNFSTFRAHQASGVVESRTWFAAQINTRDAHAALHNTKKPIGQPFKSSTSKGGEASAMYPGGFGVAELDINCMCTTIPITIGSEQASFTDAQAKAFQKQFIERMEPWVQAGIVAFRRGFAQQKRDVFAAIDERDAANRGAA